MPRVAVVYAVLLGILYQAQYKRRHAHYRVGIEPSYGIPLKLGHAVAYTDNACSKLADAQEVGKTGHEALVESYHELYDVAWSDAGTAERFHLVVGQTFEVAVGASECHRVAERARCGDIVDDFGRRNAQKVGIVKGMR